MSASRGINSPSRETVLKGTLAAEATENENPLLEEFAKRVGLFKYARDKRYLDMVDTPPQRTHTERLKRGYVSPSRRGLVPVTAHVTPELRQALHEKYQQSGYDSFNEFLTALLQRTIENTAEHDTLTKFAEVVEHTRALQKTVSDLSLDLSSHRNR